MRFPLDLIWLGRDGRAGARRPRRPAEPDEVCLRARSVVEANAGTADAFLAAGPARDVRRDEVEAAWRRGRSMTARADA